MDGPCPQTGLHLARKPQWKRPFEQVIPLHEGKELLLHAPTCEKQIKVQECPKSDSA